MVCVAMSAYSERDESKVGSASALGPASAGAASVTDPSGVSFELSPQAPSSTQKAASSRQVWFNFMAGILSSGAQMLGIGQSFGNYRIVGKLGHGAMGVVYEAEHPLIGKRVALKVIHTELARNHEVVTRFFNEARAVNQIGNDHIVDVSDFGQTDEGEHFMVMEVLAGESLADRLE